MKNYQELHVESGFNFMDQENGDGVHGEIWNQFDLNESSILYGDFPSLSDFPCMSSSSSSPAPVKPLSKCSSSSSSSSSSAASWAALKSDMQQENCHGGGRGGEYESVDVSTAALSSTASVENPNQDCLDVMEDFGFMDLLEGSDFLDTSSIFQSDDTNLLDEYQVIQQEKPQCEQITLQQQQEVNQGGAMNIRIQGANINQAPQQGESTEELAVMFFEWLKNNKDRISAEDLRRVKIKKSTIESAARRLGGGKEAMKKLLKLVLDWVQINHLERRQHRDPSAYSIDHATHQNPSSYPLPNSHPNYPVSLDPYTQPQHWVPPPQPYVATDQVTGLVGGGYMCTNPSLLGVVNSYTCMPQPENYNMLEATQTWPTHYSPFVDGNFNPGSVQGQVFTGYGNNSPYQYLPGQGDELVRMGLSATKEARKKRMARQRRNSSLHRNHGTQNQDLEQQARFENDACVPTNQGNGPNGGGNWVYWPSGVGGSSRPSTGAIHPMEVPPIHQTIDRPIVQPQQRQLASERQPGWKPENNLRFLLQKVLKQSDVGNLGRIVLPKKEAEMHLPELDARDGISIAMEDIGTSRVWNMRYSFRFWPNNKSRMYLLENTGDFVRANGLQEGDFIVIYSDVKSGKYLIRGVKVRQPGLRSEQKKPSKSHRTMHANSPAAAATASTHGHGANSKLGKQ